MEVCSPLTSEQRRHWANSCRGAVTRSLNCRLLYCDVDHSDQPDESEQPDEFEAQARDEFARLSDKLQHSDVMGEITQLTEELSRSGASYELQRAADEISRSLVAEWVQRAIGQLGSSGELQGLDTAAAMTVPPDIGEQVGQLSQELRD